MQESRNPQDVTNRVNTISKLEKRGQSEADYYYIKWRGNETHQVCLTAKLSLKHRSITLKWKSFLNFHAVKENKGTSKL